MDLRDNSFTIRNNGRTPAATAILPSQYAYRIYLDDDARPIIENNVLTDHLRAGRAETVYPALPPRPRGRSRLIRVVLNTDFTIPESDYTNNSAVVIEDDRGGFQSRRDIGIATSIPIIQIVQQGPDWAKVKVYYKSHGTYPIGLPERLSPLRPPEAPMARLPVAYLEFPLTPVVCTGPNELEGVPVGPLEGDMRVVFFCELRPFSGRINPVELETQSITARIWHGALSQKTTIFMNKLWQPSPGREPPLPDLVVERVDFHPRRWNTETDARFLRLTSGGTVSVVVRNIGTADAGRDAVVGVELIAPSSDQVRDRFGYVPTRIFDARYVNVNVARGASERRSVRFDSTVPQGSLLRVTVDADGRVLERPGAVDNNLYEASLNPEGVRRLR
jgi:hypothetical protein